MTHLFQWAKKRSAFLRIYKIIFSFSDDSSDGSELLTVSMLVMVMVVMMLLFLMTLDKEN